jgi:CRISPR/Cas system-associated endonuclease Cas1
MEGSYPFGLRSGSERRSTVYFVNEEGEYAGTLLPHPEGEATILIKLTNIEFN